MGQDGMAVAQDEVEGVEEEIAPSPQRFASFPSFPADWTGVDAFVREVAKSDDSLDGFLYSVNSAWVAYDHSFGASASAEDTLECLEFVRCAAVEVSRARQDLPDPEDEELAYYWDDFYDKVGDLIGWLRQVYDNRQVWNCLRLAFRRDHG